jgi:hypothetical protein
VGCGEAERGALVKRAELEHRGERDARPERVARELRERQGDCVMERDAEREGYPWDSICHSAPPIASLLVGRSETPKNIAKNQELLHTNFF